jgi:hypothetical protein
VKNLDPKLRIALYIVLAAAGAVLVTYGVITQDALDALIPVIAGVLMVTGGGVASANVSVKPRQADPSLLEWARMGQAAIPALLEEINRSRAAVSSDGSGLPVYDGESTADYHGKHRE